MAKQRQYRITSEQNHLKLAKNTKKFHSGSWGRNLTGSKIEFSPLISKNIGIAIISEKSEAKTKGLFIWAEVIPVSEKTFRQVYERDLALLRK